MKSYTFENSLRRRGTDRLKTMLAGARKLACECDSFHGFTCSKHDTVALLEQIISERTPRELAKDGT